MILALRCHWWLVLCAIVVLAGLTFAESMPESLAELHCLESIHGIERSQEAHNNTPPDAFWLFTRRHEIWL